MYLLKPDKEFGMTELDCHGKALEESPRWFKIFYAVAMASMLIVSLIVVN